jgi:hypothetical protein
VRLIAPKGCRNVRGRTGSAFDGDELPPKPPRMRWITYRRIEAQYENLQNRCIIGALGLEGRRSLGELER